MNGILNMINWLNLHANIRPRNRLACGLYALCQVGNNEEIKIGRISSYSALTQIYNTWYNSQGLFSGLNYYDFEHLVHNHGLLSTPRVINKFTNENTEWYHADIDTTNRLLG